MQRRVCRGVELRARITGVLVDRAEVKVEHVDLNGALMEARKRVLPGRVQDVEYTMIENQRGTARPNPFD
jgi:hypothetical protein